MGFFFLARKDYSTVRLFRSALPLFFHFTRRCVSIHLGPVVKVERDALVNQRQRQGGILTHQHFGGIARVIVVDQLVQADAVV